MREEEGAAAAVQGKGDSDEKVLEFLDSMESYLAKMESLASTLRQVCLNNFRPIYSLHRNHLSSVTVICILVRVDGERVV